MPPVIIISLLLFFKKLIDTKVNSLTDMILSVIVNSWESVNILKKKIYKEMIVTGGMVVIDEDNRIS